MAFFAGRDGGPLSAFGVMSDKGKVPGDPSSKVDLLRFKKEKAGLCTFVTGDGKRDGGEEGGDESSESSSRRKSEERRLRSSCAGLEGAVTEDGVCSSVSSGACPSRGLLASVGSSSLTLL